MNPAAHAAVAWLAARGQRLCATCRHFDAEDRELDSGVRYCRRFFVWRWPGEGEDCPNHEEDDACPDHPTAA